MNEELPIAELLRVEPVKTTRLVTVRCPFCPKNHTHGWPYGEATPGTRVAHCTNIRWAEYRIGSVIAL